MMSLVTVSLAITAFHSCCLSHHVFDQVNYQDEGKKSAINKILILKHFLDDTIDLLALSQVSLCYTDISIQVHT